MSRTFNMLWLIQLIYSKGNIFAALKKENHERKLLRDY